jgi:transcriptional regulator with XRE-family HTH domain
MTTSPTTTNNDVERSERISRGELAYVTSRNQHTAHNVLLRAVKDSGKTQKDLARLTGMDEATVSRLLRRPSNFEINTYSKLLYAACGAFIAIAPSYPQNGTGKLVHAPRMPKISETKNKNYTYQVVQASEPHIVSGVTSDALSSWQSAKTSQAQILEKQDA